MSGPIWCLLVLCWQTSVLLPTGEPARAFAHLDRLLSDAANALEEGAAVDGEALSEGLDNLYRAVARESMTRVDVTGPGFEVPVRSEALFGRVLRLPHSETPQQLLLSLQSERLFVFGMRLQASRAIHLAGLRMRFSDGSVTEHRLGDGSEGRSFAARRKTPLFQGWRGVRRAAVLEAIEIEGMARDPGEPAELSLLFSIPDPASRPFRRATERLQTMRSRWSELDLDREGLSKRQEDMNLLRSQLGIVGPR